MKVKRTIVRGLVGCFVAFAMSAAASAATVHIAGRAEVYADPGVTVPVEFEIIVDTAAILDADTYDYSLGVSGAGAVFDYASTESATDALAALPAYVFPGDGDGAWASQDFVEAGPNTIYASDLSGSGDGYDPTGKSLGVFVINVTGGVGNGIHVISGGGGSAVPGFDGGLIGVSGEEGFAVPDFEFNVLASPTLTWDGTDSGPWTGAHWNPGPIAPGGNEHMVVDSGTVVVSSDLTATPAASLAIADGAPGGTVSIGPAGTLAVTGGASVGAGGRLSIDGTLTAPAVEIIGGSLANSPDSCAPVIVSGDVVLGDGGALVVDLLGAGTDTLAAGGAVALESDASLEIVVYGGDKEFDAGTYTLILAGGELSGTFADVTVPAGYVSVNGNGLTYDYVADTVTLTLDKNLNPGDGNLDGQTDVSDRIIWNSNNFTFGTTFQTGDFNGDGLTDVSDRIIWNNYNFTFATAAPGPLAAPMVPIPEPATLGLLALGGLAMLWRRRTR